MPQLTFYPLGNADCCLIDLAGDEKILFDFADVADPDDDDDKRIALSDTLRENLDEAERDDFDVVAFTHLDDDHIHGASDFFYLEHAEKYQDGDRIKIKTLWVPAAAILEEGLDDDARIIRAEARHRLISGEGIRIFSRPTALEKWLKDQGLTLESRKHLITDAGGLAPDFDVDTHGVEFFVHSPFAHRQDKESVIDRNTDSLGMQAKFVVDGVETKFFLGSDLDHEALSTIVQITKSHNNEERLEWDVVKLPHHCSYKSLGPDKGKVQTEPVDDVAWLYEEQGQKGGKIVSTSKPIPDTDEKQPPHFQAANYYKDLLGEGGLDGEFLVTMEHPDTDDPEPLVIIIDGTKSRVKTAGSLGVAAIVSQSTPRAG